MRAARENNEDAVRSLVDPDTILLLPLRINAESIIRRKAHPEYARGFQNRTRQKKSQEHQEAG
jgi:hypothetical protein